VLAAGSYAAAVPGWTSHQMALSFGPQPAHYSELFFADISALPARLSPGAENTVPFTIVNREGGTHQYTYVVTLAGPAGAVVAEQGQVTVKNNGKADLTARFKPGVHKSAYTVSIKIDNPSDHIEFHGRTT
jgi:uncharacterized protein YfaS (alpha-2-macroglobulin family)